MKDELCREFSVIIFLASSTFQHTPHKATKTVGSHYSSHLILGKAMGGA